METIKAIIYYLLIGAVYVFISLHNAVVELYTALRSMLIWSYWVATGCTTEYIIETEDGEVIHHFPQLNYGDDDDL